MMDKPRVFVNRNDHDPALLAPLEEAGFELDIYQGTGLPPRNELLRRVKGTRSVN